LRLRFLGCSIRGVSLRLQAIYLDGDDVYFFLSLIKGLTLN
jgi:hypothetical protein